MTRYLIALFAFAGSSTGCFDPSFQDPLACGLDGACPSGQRCSPQQICEDGSDTGAGQPVDAGAPATAGPLTISEPTTIDTDNSPLCTIADHEDCIVVATMINIHATLRATGTRPLVLLASDSITVSQLIDVGSHRSPAESIGAGADPAGCVGGTAASTYGGGAGGSFAGFGGNGGAGGAGAAGGLPASVVAQTTALRGGCRGQDGNGDQKGTGGHGGGAVQLIAGERIDISGPGINAAGEGGTGGGPVTIGPSGGGGGGAGGMIALDAPTITCTGLLLANGGGGGQGSGTQFAGSTGADPFGLTAASGGALGSEYGGNGGNGSAGIVGGSGTSGGIGMFADPAAGGGGGGGGAGLVRAPTSASLGAQLSPLPTLF